jgi:poly(3-hydroxybutyrate) depolymerase
MTTISLRPGTPDDDNRDYLPESIKGSDIVVNENGNNSQPYPVRLQEHVEPVIDDEPDTWYTYVPESYDPSTPTPLVISMHGGLMTGWGQAVYTSWTLLAEREGFIVLFPNAHHRRFWLIDVPHDAIEAATTYREDEIYLNMPPASADSNRDLQLVLALIERVATEYSIDRTRVFMQGMSMGNVMTGQFARYFGDILAGAAGSGGPSAPGVLFDAEGTKLNRAGHLAIFQTRLERDAVPPHYGAGVRDVLTLNRDYWIGLNGTNSVPAITIRGENNLAFYEGGAAPVVFRDVKNRDHGQTLDDAEYVWSYLFSGVARQEDGSITVSQSRWPRNGDAVGIAVSAGRDKVWKGQNVEALGAPAFLWSKLKYHGLQGAAEIRGEYVYVPLEFLSRDFAAELRHGDGVADLTLGDGRTLSFARGSVVSLVDGDVVGMLAEAVERDGRLFISLEWFARDILGLHTSQCENVLYVTDHHAELSRNMAHLIDDLLA